LNANIRRAVISICAWSFGGAVVGFGLATVTPKRYAANTLLFFANAQKEGQSLGRGLVQGTSMGAGVRLLDGQVFLPTVGSDQDAVRSIMRSRSAAEMLADVYGKRLFDAPDRDRLIERIADALKVETTQSGQIAVSFEHPDRKIATEVVARITTYTETTSRKIGREFAQGSLKFLQDNVNDKRAELDTALRKLETATTRSELALVAVARDKQLEELFAIRANVNKLEVEFQQAEGDLKSRLSAIETAIKQGPKGTALNQETARLRTRLLELQTELNETRRRYVPGSTQLTQIQQQVDAASQAYLDEIAAIAGQAESGAVDFTLTPKANQDGLKQALVEARRQLLTIENRNKKLVALEIEQRLLKATVERAESELKAAIIQLSAAQVAESKTYAPFVVVDKAYASTIPVFPRRSLFTIGLFGAGFLIGGILNLRRLRPEETTPETSPA